MEPASNFRDLTEDDEHKHLCLSRFNCWAFDRVRFFKEGEMTGRPSPDYRFDRQLQ